MAVNTIAININVVTNLLLIFDLPFINIFSIKDKSPRIDFCCEKSDAKYASSGHDLNSFGVKSLFHLLFQVVFPSNFESPGYGNLGMPPKTGNY